LVEVWAGGEGRQPFLCFRARNVFVLWNTVVLDAGGRDGLELLELFLSFCLWSRRQKDAGKLSWLQIV
jgi:hypothetical protein